jgi:hypothetical protein
MDDTKIKKIGGVENDDLLDHEINILKHYKLKESSLSCYLEDIDSFVVGPTVSRFWGLRKHINLTDTNDLSKNKLPFYAWECITLNVKNRKIYLVVKNEKMMVMLIKFLIGTLNTVDGSRGSAVGIKKALFEQAMNDEINNINMKFKDQFDTRVLTIAPSTEQQVNIKKEIAHNLLMKTTLKYKIIRMRNKLSFIAFQKR